MLYSPLTNIHLKSHNYYPQCEYGSCKQAPIPNKYLLKTITTAQIFALKVNTTTSIPAEP